MEFEIPFFKSKKHVEFEDIIDWKVIAPDEKIATGDILLFSGSSFVSSGLKFFTTSRWNHVGMAAWVELTHKDKRKSKDLFVFELGSQPYTDLMSRKMLDKKVRLVRLGDIATMYDIISHRRINVERNNEWCHKFQAFMLRWNKTPFFSMSTTIKAFYITPGAEDNVTTCAHLTAKMLEHMGVNKVKFDPSQLAPSHFSSCSKAFDDNIFIGPDRVIYKDQSRINARLTFTTAIFVFLIIIFIYIYFKAAKRKK